MLYEVITPGKGNIYDFLSQRLAGKGGKGSGTSHNRYFLWDYPPGKGNIYGFLSQRLAGTGGNLAGKGGNPSDLCQTPSGTGARPLRRDYS